MFCESQNLTSIDVSGFDTSEVIDMSDMFTECKSLINLDVSGFVTSKQQTLVVCLVVVYHWRLLI